MTKWSLYFPIYERHLTSWRNIVIGFCEIVAAAMTAVMVVGMSPSVVSRTTVRNNRTDTGARRSTRKGRAHRGDRKRRCTGRNSRSHRTHRYLGYSGHSNQ